MDTIQNISWLFGARFDPDRSSTKQRASLRVKWLTQSARPLTRKHAKARFGAPQRFRRGRLEMEKSSCRSEANIWRGESRTATEGRLVKVPSKA